MPFDQGDGAEARVYFERAEEKRLLFGRWLHPSRIEADRRWSDEIVDLTPFAGQAGQILLECNSGPDLDVIGDWVAFSGLRVLPAATHAPAHVDAAARNPAWLHLTPAFARRGELVVVSVGGGAGMTIDCRYTLDGVSRLRRAWFTADAAGQHVFRPAEPGRWEVVAIKNASSEKWVESRAYLVVQ
jgi:hypothetical protein